MKRDPSRRIGAWCLIAGSVVVLLARTAHGDLPTDTGREALSYVASRPLYALIHFADVLGFFVWACGFAALSGSLTNRLSRAVGHLGLVSVIVGVAVHITEFSIDGFGLPMLAREWTSASAADRLNLEKNARLVLVALGGPGVTALALAWGTTLATYGIAVKQDGYRASLGWTGLVTGIAIVALAAIFFLEPNIYPGVMLFGLGTFLAHGWSIALGIAMWRRVE